MNWNNFKSKLNLDEEQAASIKKIIARGKDQFAEICLRSPDKNDMSPVDYVARIRAKHDQLHEDEFREKFIRYLSEKKDPVSGRTYLNVGEELDTLILKEVDKLLNEGEREMLKALGTVSFLFIDTGYDPLMERIQEQMENERLRIQEQMENERLRIQEQMENERLRIQEQMENERHRKFLKQIEHMRDVKWDELRTKLNLDKTKAASIKKIIDRGKEQFAEICLRKTVNGSRSPVEYAARVKNEAAYSDEVSFRKKFVTYLSERIEPVNKTTYLKAGQDIDASLLNEVRSLLSVEERSSFDAMGIGSLLYVDTGCDPLEDRLMEEINSLRLNRIEAVTDHRFKGFFCPLPFEYISVCDNGDVYLCSACKMRSSVGNLNRHSLAQIWNSESAVKVREAIFDGSYKYCNENECELLQDRKLRKKEEFTEGLYGTIVGEQVTVLERGPRTIEVSYDKSCNLACPYCRQDHIIHKGRELERLKAIHSSVFEHHLQGVRRLMISGSGDPLASSFHRRVLEGLDREQFPDIRIKLQTNGLLLTPEMWKRISSSHYAIDWISISIDAATAETYKINRGGNFDRLLEILDFVSGLRKNDAIETLNINFVVQANNFREMKQFIEMGKRFGCDYINFQKIMNLGIDYGLYSEEEYRKVAVHLDSHPDYKEFLDVLNDPIFLDPRIGLFKLIEYFPEEIRKKKDVDSIIDYYPSSERGRIYR